jgi:hypothetical protein
VARRPRALCSREEVKRLLPNYVEPEDAGEKATADEIIDDFIDSATQRIYEVSGREFLAWNDPGEQGAVAFPEPAPVAREIEASMLPATPGISSARMVKIGDLRRLDSIAYSRSFQSSAATPIPLADAIAHPRARAPWQPIRWLELRRGVYEGEVFTVTGIWGFPAVPADVVQACAEQAAFWSLRDLAKLGAIFVDAAAAGLQATEPRSLLQSVYDTAAFYRPVEV